MASRERRAQEDDESNCSYYMKTGACRFGTRCKWRHPIPARSTTILIRNMYDGLGIVGHRVSDEDFDDGLDVSALLAAAAA
jgi:hypothetical protein